MVDVFISYSRADLEQVSRLAQAIEREGYSVWWDKELPPHLSYGDVITEKIASSKAAVVVWSATAAKSEWVRAEADMARNQRKLVQTALGEIMPPLPFNQIQFAEIGDWNGEADHQGWRKVKASLADLCGERAGSAGSPNPSPVAAPPAPSLPPTPTPAARWPLLAGGGVAVLALVAAVALVAGWGEDERPSTQPPAASQASQSEAATQFALGATVSDPDGYTNLRSAGSTDSAILARIAVGDRFLTYRQPGNWWQVQLDDGTIGYVARSRIVLDGEPAPSVPAPAPAPLRAEQQAVPIPAAPPPGDMTFPDSSTRRLSEAEVATLGPATLRIARNEIYARKGRRFANRELAEYFSQFAWYRPVADEVRLNAIERDNVALLARAERRYGR